MRFLAAMLLVAALANGGLARGAEPTLTIKDFYGSYVGVGATRSLEKAARDRVASLKIAPTGDGFSLTWSTTIGIWSNNDRRVRTQSLRFRTAGRPGRWRAVASGDPLNNGMLSWARLTGRDLVVYVVTVDRESGELTAAIWRRTLTDKGLAVRYERLRDARRIRRASARLTRTK